MCKNHNSFPINYLKDLNIVMATSFNPLNYKLVLLFGIHVSCQVVQSTRISIPVPLALKNWPEFFFLLSLDGMLVHHSFTPIIID